MLRFIYNIIRKTRKGNLKSICQIIFSASLTSPVLRKCHAETAIAFFANVALASVDHLSTHQNIVFENVVTNLGSAYNNSQGVFVAPVSGLYLITTSVLSRQNEEFWAAVVVNGAVIARLNGRGTDGRHGTGTQTMILALQKGKRYSGRNLLKRISIINYNVSSQCVCL